MVKFPYSFRRGQKEALKFIKGVGGNLCIDAPTGFGKTPVILSAFLNKIHPIIWAVRTGNEADRPVEELKAINEITDESFFGFSFRGKRDMCLAARERDIADTESVAYFCQKNRNKCQYYINLSNYRIKPFEPLLYSDIIQLSAEAEICPYYLQRELLQYADLVALSYNYIIHPGMSWVIKSIIPFRECYLVVDEAHNLRLIGNINSDYITLNTFKNAIKELEELGEEVLREIVEELMQKAREIHFDMVSKKEKERILDIFIFESSYMREIKRNGEVVRKKKLEEGKTPRSSLYHLATFFIESMKFKGVVGVAFIATAEKNNLILERWDMRSAEILRDVWGQFKRCIFCSGTLKPIKAFAETVGLNEWNGRSFRTDFGKCRSLIIKGMTTGGEELSDEEAKKYIRVFTDFLDIDCNLAFFSASYRIQNRLLPELKRISEEKEREVFVERQGMSGDEGRKILDGFKKRGGVLIATMTGRFAEGADFPGKELEGIFLAGIPFDRMTLRTKLYIDYYRKLYGEERGWYYSYVIPAMQRASQTLGRALRSVEDRAIFILGDERYHETIYRRLLPIYIKPDVVEFDEAGLKMMEAWKELSEG